MRIVKRVYIFLNDDGRSAERHREKVHVIVRTLNAKINRHGLIHVVQSLKKSCTHHTHARARARAHTHTHTHTHIHMYVVCMYVYMSA